MTKRDELIVMRNALITALEVIDGLYDQQAMPDDSQREKVETLRKLTERKL